MGFLAERKRVYWTIIYNFMYWSTMRVSR